MKKRTTNIPAPDRPGAQLLMRRPCIPDIEMSPAVVKAYKAECKFGSDPALKAKLRRVTSIEELSEVLTDEYDRVSCLPGKLNQKLAMGISVFMRKHDIA